MEQNYYDIKQLNRSLLRGIRKFSPLGHLEKQICAVLGLKKLKLHELRTSKETALADLNKLNTGLLIFAKQHPGPGNRFEDIEKAVKAFYKKRGYKVEVGKIRSYLDGYYKDRTLKVTNNDKAYNVEVGQGDEYRVKIEENGNL